MAGSSGHLWDFSAWHRRDVWRLFRDVVRSGLLDGAIRIVWHRIGCLAWGNLHGLSRLVGPTRKGFGSRLIERALVSELRDEVRVGYPSSGVECTIIAPISAGEEFVPGRTKWPERSRSGY